MLSRFLRPASFCVALLAGCAMDTQQEEDALDDVSFDDLAAADSFAAPTAHGNLAFGVRDDASFETGHLFHSWRFELSGDARVTLATEATDRNLDTVLYLYHRDAGARAWGSYLVKADNDGRRLTSRLVRSLGAGEYRIVIKTFRSAMRGDFSLVSACSGAGCPAAPGPNLCDTYEMLPTETHYAHACDARVTGALTGRVTTSREKEIASHAQYCALPSLERRALDYYTQYWEVQGLSDPEQEAGSKYLTTSKYASGGSAIRVSYGGDEDSVTFLFDARDGLIVAFWSNQSPVATWYCGGTADEGEPDAMCVGEVLEHAPVRAGSAFRCTP